MHEEAGVPVQMELSASQEQLLLFPSSCVWEVYSCALAESREGFLTLRKFLSRLEECG